MEIDRVINLKIDNNVLVRDLIDILKNEDPDSKVSFDITDPERKCFVCISNQFLDFLHQEKIKNPKFEASLLEQDFGYRCKKHMSGLKPLSF